MLFASMITSVPPTRHCRNRSRSTVNYGQKGHTTRNSSILKSVTRGLNWPYVQIIVSTECESNSYNFLAFETINYYSSAEFFALIRSFDSGNLFSINSSFPSTSRPLFLVLNKILIPVNLSYRSVFRCFKCAFSRIPDNSNNFKTGNNFCPFCTPKTIYSRSITFELSSKRKYWGVIYVKTGHFQILKMPGFMVCSAVRVCSFNSLHE